MGAVLAYGRGNAEHGTGFGLLNAIFSWPLFIVGWAVRDRGTPFLLYRNPHREAIEKAQNTARIGNAVDAYLKVRKIEKAPEVTPEPVYNDEYFRDRNVKMEMWK